MGRRLQLLLALAVVTTALGAVTASGASFVSDSATTVQASTSGLGADTMVIAGGNGQTAVAGTPSRRLRACTCTTAAAIPSPGSP